MKQESFEALYADQWRDFETWLAYRKKPKKLRQETTPPFTLSELPQRYRVLCRLLALARDRDFSLALVEHLHRLVQEGHDILYGSPGGFGQRLLAYIGGGFAVDVRANRKFVLASMLLFFGSYIAIMIAIRIWPDFVYIVMPYDMVFTMRDMYSDRPAEIGQFAGAAGDNVAMFGYYIMNNVSIAFRCFASGLAAGIGTILVLLQNGVMIGAVEADLNNAGLSHNFYSFVAGHSSFELGAIAIIGGAGLKLGAALVAPGRRSRGEALRHAARGVIGIVGGCAVMLFAAALVEAFWSPLRFSLSVKLAVGGLLLVATLAYFLLAGRRRAA